ncbi:MAG TPA: hypothetical protein VFL91_21355 [Thermomicrobiales bacterium]|nr:hypothetical protein [Thermomicrobiales bacterium]
MYLEVGLSPFGKPLEEFLLDPPQRIPVEEFGISPVGMHFITPPGQTEPVIFDWIGSEHYPNVADVVEEWRHCLRVGVNPVSRRISRTTDFSQIRAGAKLVELHARAIIENHAELEAAASAYFGPTASGCAWPTCPTGKISHKPSPPASPSGGAEQCIRLWWEDVAGGESADSPTPSRPVRREIGDTTYYARRTPEGVTPRYVVGAFAVFTISNIAVVRDPDDPARDEDNLARASKSGLEVRLVDE